MQFTVLDRPVVVEFIGRWASNLSAEVTRVFGDLVPQAVSGGVAQLTVDTGAAGTDVLLERLAQDLCTWSITQRRADLLMLHAGGLAHPTTGAAVGFVGPSGAGKSTVVTTLGRRWGYLGDEVLALTDEGRVVPLRKPVSVVVPGRSTKDLVPAGDLGLMHAPQHPHLSGLIYLDRRSTTTVDASVMRTVDALALLAPQVSFLGTRPRPLGRLALQLERIGGLRHVTYQECADLGDVVHDLMAARQ